MDGNSFDDLSVSGGSIYTDGGAGFNKFDAGFNVGLGAEYKGFRLMVGYQQGLMNIADEDSILMAIRTMVFMPKLDMLLISNGKI